MIKYKFDSFGQVDFKISLSLFRQNIMLVNEIVTVSFESENEHRAFNPGPREYDDLNKLTLNFK